MLEFETGVAARIRNQESESETQEYETGICIQNQESESEMAVETRNLKLAFPDSSFRASFEFMLRSDSRFRTHPQLRIPAPPPRPHAPSPDARPGLGPAPSLGQEV